MKKGYFAYVLERESHELLAEFATYPNLRAHHITVAFMPNDSVYTNWEKKLGEKKTFTITSLLADEKSQVATIQSEIPDKNNFHITISFVDSVDADYSNQLLKKKRGLVKLKKTIEVHTVLTWIEREP